MSARIVLLILSDQLRVGRGTADDPVRIRRQLFTPEGRLLAWLEDGGKGEVLSLDVPE